MLIPVGCPVIVTSRSSVLADAPGCPGSMIRIWVCEAVLISLILAPALPMTGKRGSRREQNQLERGQKVARAWGDSLDPTRSLGMKICWVCTPGPLTSMPGALGSLLSLRSPPPPYESRPPACRYVSREDPGADGRSWYSSRMFPM